MKHLSWNHKGYDDLGLDIKDGYIMQRDWNATILGSINEAFGDNEHMCNVFVSRKYLPIFESILIYDNRTKTVGDRIKLIPIEFDTPKMYVTEGWMDTFVGLEHNNYGSVVIKNYTE